MKPFQLPTWRKRHLAEVERKQDAITQNSVRSMERVMHTAVDAILDNYAQTGRYAEPSLNGMFDVSQTFYRGVVVDAFHSAQAEKDEQIKGHKRLAKLPMGLPRTMRDLTKVFRDRRYWPKIMKRSDVLTERLRKEYLEKLRKKFDKIVPMMLSGEITPREAKEHLRSAWQASKSRVESLYRTETTSYFARTQVAFFQGDPEIIGFMFDSVADVSRTEWCRSRHGLIYRPGETRHLITVLYNTPALHWWCRSHLLALANTPHNRKLLEDPDRDPARKSVAPLHPSWRK